MNRVRPELAITFSIQSFPILTPLILFAGVHPIYFGFHRMLSKAVPFLHYDEVEDAFTTIEAPWMASLDAA